MRFKSFPGFSISKILVLVILLTLTACVSRYDPVDKIQPLSSDCEDYAAFSKALAKQRDNGFTKRATMNIAAYSVGNQHDRDLLYKRYQVMLDIVFADRLIDPNSIKVMGKIVCEQRQRRVWQPLQQDDLATVTTMIRQCRNENDALVDVEDCIIAKLEEYWSDDLAAPPGYNRL